MNAKLEHFIKTREFEVFARLKDIPTPDLTLFAYDCDKGLPLEQYCNGVTVDEVLRSLASLQILRELARRQDLEELEG
ncbi:hypothetical protein [Lacipirellula sp.]|uniref:hypothetical protein n=1 Tax=Lacipirellula sp. TaxID=2691419 RepID=UPI003D1049A4